MRSLSQIGPEMPLTRAEVAAILRVSERTAGALMKKLGVIGLAGQPRITWGQLRAFITERTLKSDLELLPEFDPGDRLLKPEEAAEKLRITRERLLDKISTEHIEAHDISQGPGCELSKGERPTFRIRDTEVDRRTKPPEKRG